MLNDAKCFDKIYIACCYTDLSIGIDGLASKITLEFGMKPFCPRVLFLFCGRKSDRIKGLVWEEDGFLLLYKRLEAGKFKWPRNEDDVKAITPEQYTWLMQGLSIEQKKIIKKVTPLSPL